MKLNSKRATMTNQETFDTIVRAIIKQGSYSTNEMGFCRYRGRYGRKCAAGHLIPDSEYDPKFEAYDSLSENGKPTLPGKKIAALGHNLELVSALQSAHDAAATYPNDFGRRKVHDFRKRACSIALLWDLDASCCDE